jgi:3-methyladenine DNA glycosylase AlkC/predicted GIY-YIG superfamily endonuclease
MVEPLKNLYGPEFIERLATYLKKASSSFKKASFIKIVLDEEWEDRELKQRMRHLSKSMGKFLSSDYSKALEIILDVAPFYDDFTGLIFPDFVEVFGQNDWKKSIKALEELTQYSSSELAIRPFLISDQERGMKQMLKWSKHKNYHIRRLASEGCRPRLPWAMALPKLKEDPCSILPILENLKHDESEYVRRSVANNLNDISKDHPRLVLKLAKKWQQPKTEKLIKHGLRTLLKKGDQKALALFGLSGCKDVSIKKMSIPQKFVSIEGEVEFIADYHVKKKSLLRFEYAMYFLRKNGEYSRKVFKISEKEVESGKFQLIRKHSFRKISTRVYYPGLHKIELIINGKVYTQSEFQLQEKQDWFVYMIETDKRKIYTGIAKDDVERRFEEHKKDPKKGAKFFRSQIPKKLLHIESYPTRSEALKREAAIKKLKRSDKINLSKPSK